MEDRGFTRARKQLVCTLASLAPVPGGFSQIGSYKLEYADVENEQEKLKTGMKIIFELIGYAGTGFGSCTLQGNGVWVE